MILPTTGLTRCTSARLTTTNCGFAAFRSANVICPPAALVQSTCSTPISRTVTARAPVARTKKRTRNSYDGSEDRSSVQNPGEPDTFAEGTFPKPGAGPAEVGTLAAFLSITPKI